MLVLRRVSVWLNAYDVIRDGSTVATYGSGFWNQDGLFTLDGRRYRVRGTLYDRQLTLIDEQDEVVAAGMTGLRRRWTVWAAGRTIDVRCPSLLRTRTEIRADDGLRLGALWRPSRWRRTIATDLASMPEPVAVFVLAAVVFILDRRFHRRVVSRMFADVSYKA